MANTTETIDLVEMYYNLPHFDLHVYDDDTYPDNGEQGHEACLFQPGSLPSPLTHDTTLQLTQLHDLPTLIVRLPTRQEAADLAVTLMDYTDKSGSLLFFQALVNVVQSRTKEILVAGTDLIHVSVLCGHTSKENKPHLLVRPCQLRRFIGLPLDEIAHEATAEPNVFRLV